MSLLPPLPALEALDALERSGSVSEAARLCRLSQSAVSHKLRALETRLGFRLTEPSGRGVVLTPQARRYLAAVRPGLAALREAHRGIGAVQGTLEISCVSGLAATWLAPRLGGFLNLFPEVSLHLRSDMVGQPHPGADLAIIFTATPPPGARHLLEVRFFPVCSPALFHEAGSLPPAQMLRPDLLLHLNNRSDWGAWLAEAGADPGLAGGGLHFSDLLALYAAAGAGLGLCLGDRITSDDALASGRLIRPYPQEIPARAGYWALPAQGGLTPPAAAFLDWLSVEMRQTAG